MRSLLRVPLASVAALLLVAIGATVTRQLAGGAVSLALAVPVVVWLGLETPVIEGAIGSALVGALLDASAGGPSGLLTFLSVMVFVGVRAGAGPFDARSPLGFGLLSGAATLGMGFGAVAPPALRDPFHGRSGLEPARARAGRVGAHRAGRARHPLGARSRARPRPPRPARGAPVREPPWR